MESLVQSNMFSRRFSFMRESINLRCESTYGDRKSCPVSELPTDNAIARCEPTLHAMRAMRGLQMAEERSDEKRSVKVQLYTVYSRRRSRSR